MKLIKTHLDYVLYLVWALICFLILGSFTDCQEDQKQTIEKNGEIRHMEIYSTYFADYRRSSFEDIEPHYSGAIQWSVPLHLTDKVTPRSIFVWKKHIVLETMDKIQIYSSNGNLIFEKKKNYGAPIGILGDFLFSQDEKFWLTAFNILGEIVLEESDFPNANNKDFSVSLLAPEKDEFISVIQFNGGPAELPPEIFVQLSRYGEILPIWQNRFKGIQSLQPLYIPEKELIVVFLNEIIFYNAKNGSEFSRQGFPIETIYSASADTNGVIYFSGEDQKKYKLAAMYPDGKLKWLWQDLFENISFSKKQPPIQIVDNKTNVIVGNKIFSVSDGELLWTFEINENSFLYGTSFKDGSTLFTAGQHLYHLNSIGELIFDIEVDLPIVAPPVVDFGGSIYVATTKTLLKIH